MPFGLKEAFEGDLTLKGRMYADYRAYYLRRGVDEDTLMSFSEWERYLGVEEFPGSELLDSQVG